MRWTYGVIAVLSLTTACGRSPTEPEEPEPEPPPPAEAPESLLRSWWVRGIPLDGSETFEMASGDERDGVVVDERFELGPLVLGQPGQDPFSYATVFSNADGSTYWTSAQSTPGDATEPVPLMGGWARLEQLHTFRKTAGNAELRVVITKARMESFDGNAQAPRRAGCRWYSGERPEVDECEQIMRGTVWFRLDAQFYDLEPEVPVGGYFYRTGGSARLQGFLGTWRRKAYTTAYGEHFLWSDSLFTYVPNSPSDATGGRWELAEPITIDIPMDTVPVGDVVILTSNVRTRAYSRRGQESVISAFFRDPLEADGGEVHYTGLEPIDLDDLPEPPTPDPACSVAPTGTIQFDTTFYDEPEQDGALAWITVTREGGGEGMAIARVRTRGGDATVGADYVEVDDLVYFMDGEQGERVVEVEIVADTIAEENETVELELFELPGCGSVGNPSTTTLEIQDDDRPPYEDPTYTLGGTVNGLEGTGLVLGNFSIDYDTIDTAGPFAFERDFPDGYPYDVEVEVQPTDPTQSCTVTNGEGRIEGEDVTDIVVDCLTLEQEDGLDPAFGSAGKVWSSQRGEAEKILLQADGKALVLAAERIDRHLDDGSLDPAFGTGGSADVSWAAASFDAMSMALYDDGRIVVVGHAPTETAQRAFVVARIETDGAPDLRFGTDGSVVIEINDVAGATDVEIASDGSIIVGGHITNTDFLLGNDFAVLRVTPDGELDTTFGTGGVSTVNIGGQTDLSHAIALQPDDRILQVGRVASSGGADPDVALVRWDADGHLDATFDGGGVVRVATPVWDQAEDVLVQPDGRILVGGFQRPSFAVPYQFLILRFESDGSPDRSYGTDGAAHVQFLPDGNFLNGLTLDYDGVLAVGVATEAGASDFAIVRLGPTGQPDAGFGDGGMRTYDFFGDYDEANSVAVQPDGRIWVAGSVRNGGSVVSGLARLVRPLR